MPEEITRLPDVVTDVFSQQLSSSPCKDPNLFSECNWVSPDLKMLPFGVVRFNAVDVLLWGEVLA